MPSQLIREVIKEYERDRDKAENARTERVAAARAAVPRLAEIDARLAGLGLEVSRRILEGGDAAGLTAELAAESERLNAEKLALLRKHGLENDYIAGYACDTCKDTGFVSGKRCSCFQRRLIAKFYHYSNLEKVLKKENFDTFNMELYSAEVDPKTGTSPRNIMSQNFGHALNFVKNFGEEFINLLFFGKTGLGKTFLCNCIAKELLDHGYAVIYVTSPQLFKLVEKARFERDEDDGADEFLEVLMESDLLIIDDLGAEMPTAVTIAELFNIINTRLLSRRPTIISTNYDIPEINDNYSDRITSRIFGNYTVLRFAGEDIRIKIRYKI